MSKQYFNFEFPQFTWIYIKENLHFPSFLWEFQTQKRSIDINWWTNRIIYVQKIIENFNPTTFRQYSSSEHVEKCNKIKCYSHINGAATKTLITVIRNIRNSWIFRIHHKIDEWTISIYMCLVIFKWNILRINNMVDIRISSFRSDWKCKTFKLKRRHELFGLKNADINNSTTSFLYIFIITHFNGNSFFTELK